MEKYLKPIILTALGVIVAGIALKWGYDNDIPGLKEAAGGFDQ
tara:strand:+ start:4696 stop:4824 length:129 start_codon:yes stop_codon:yes gene_type:complete